ncbi:MAG: phosphoenolpyruvate carboxykinase, partial [Chlamydiota bacterium]
MKNKISNEQLRSFIQEAVELCQPDHVYLCDGSDEEYNKLAEDLVVKRVFAPLNPSKRPGSFWCHSDPDDVARVEDATFICSKSKEDAGPTNNWRDPQEM